MFDNGIFQHLQDFLCKAKEGKLQRSARGVYYLTGTDLTEHHHLVEATLRAPRGVVCLLSALRFHNLTTQSPFEVWMAIDRKAHLPAAGGHCRRDRQPFQENLASRRPLAK